MTSRYGKRSKVVWKPAAELPVVEARPFYLEGWLVEPRIPEWAGGRQIEPGDLFTTVTALGRLALQPNVLPPPHPYLIEAWIGGCVGRTVPVGTMALYLGSIHVSDRRADPIRRLRHTFLIDGAEVIIYHLHALRPLETLP
jgi:hypothetical protein